MLERTSSESAHRHHGDLPFHGILARGYHPRCRPSRSRLVGAVFLVGDGSLGSTINLLTLLAIVLSVGLVVDDAIVVVENVDVPLAAGREAFLTPPSREPGNWLSARSFP